MTNDVNPIKRVARNSFFMYVRLIFLMAISFYTSRVLLNLLGIEDYGIYSVVGSISSSFVALKSLFSEAIQRFLNVAKGKNNSINEQIAIFNFSIIIHVLLIFFFVIIVEVLGVWLLNNKLEIPEARIEIAFFVFQMSLLSMSIGLLSISYDALIIANEEMGFYAIISVLDGVLKLAFVLLLPYVGGDYLKQYSIFLVLTPLLTLLLQLFYCRRYEECIYRFRFDKKLFKGILVLSGWNFMGNICFSIIHEGINMLLNIVGGVRLNASRAIAYQLKNVTLQVASNTMIAVRPIAMKQSIQKSLSSYFDTIFLISRLSFFLNLLPIVPLFFYCPMILDIWLVEVPEYTVLFTRLVLLGLIIRSLHEPINIMHMALGNIKRMLTIEGSIMVTFLLLIYIVLKVYNSVWIPFLLLAVMECCIIIGLIVNAKYEVGLPIKKYFINIVMPMLKILFLLSIIISILYNYIQPSSITGLIVIVLCILLIEISTIYIFMSEREKDIIKVIINK